MNNLQETIGKTREGLLPSISQNLLSFYKSAMILALLLSAVPLIAYFLS